MKRLEELKQKYMETPIPEELDAVVMKALTSRERHTFRWRMLTVATAAAVLGFCLAVNVSPALAKTLSDIPIVGDIVRVITIREYTFEDENFQADIEVPAIENLQDPDLEDLLNEKYLEESRRLYAEFEAEMENVKELGDGHLSVSSGYIVRTDNDRILSIGRYVVKSMGSSSDDITYDTIDKQNKLLITLPMLFKDDDYISIISENIKQQMRDQMAAEPGVMYWLPETASEYTPPFESIDANQDFYINSDGKLVISFDKYEVGPGVMGVVEFTIPTEVIADELVSQEYIH